MQADLEEAERNMNGLLHNFSIESLFFSETSWTVHICLNTMVHQIPTRIAH